MMVYKDRAMSPTDGLQRQGYGLQRQGYVT